MEKMDHQVLLNMVLELSNRLYSTGIPYSISLTIGDFSFSLDTRGKATSNGSKRKSPSAIRRNTKRRQEFLLKKKAPSTSGQPPRPGESPGNDMEPPSHQDIDYPHCDTQRKSFKSLDMHVRKKHTDKQNIIPQWDGSNDLLENNNRLEGLENDVVNTNQRLVALENNLEKALENSVVNNYKRIEGLMTWKNDMGNDMNNLMTWKNEINEKLEDLDNDIKCGGLQNDVNFHNFCLTKFFGTIRMDKWREENNHNEMDHD